VDCPCGSGAALEACCGPYLSQERAAPTAEALMRSRYTAYVRGAIDHVEATHHPRTVSTFDRPAATAWARGAEWLGLTVVSTAGGGPSDDTGEVEFIARYRQEGSALSHHERARFEKVGGKWFFVDGQMVGGKTVVRDQPKVGRNDPCPCGSGKKYKKCHGAEA
jgi:SEC-C motif-containing protein